MRPFHSKILIISFSVMIGACSILTPQDFGIEEVEKSSKYEAGTVNIASFQPIPWYSIVDSLKPRFEITSATVLLPEVAPIVGGDDYRASQRIAAQLQAAVAGDIVGESRSETSTTAMDADGNETSTLSRTTDREVSRATPDSLANSATLPASLIGSPGDMGDFTFDPELKYRAATALFQNIQLLDKYLETAPGGYGQDSYLMRVQLTVSPFAHQMPYDIYTTLLFSLKGSNVKRSEQLNEARHRVFPLVVAENLERINTRRIAESLQSIELALSGRAGAIASGAQFKSALEKLRTLVGTDLNSLITYSQPDDQSMQIRFGAAFNPKSGYSTRARTYDVMFVVVFDDVHGGSQFEVFAESEFRHARTGKSIPAISKSDMKSLSRKVQQDWQIGGCYKKNKYYGGTPGCRADASFDDKNWEPLEFVQTAVMQSDDQKARALIEFFLDGLPNYQLYKDLQRARESRKGRFTTVNLPSVDSRPPSNQVPIFYDDGKKLTVALGEAGRVDISKLRSGIYFTQKEIKTRIRSGEMLSEFNSRSIVNNEVGQQNQDGTGRFDQFPLSNEGPFLHTGARYSGRTLNLEFPSLAALSYDTNKGSVYLTYSNRPDGTQSQLFKLKRLESSAAPPRAPSFKVSTVSRSFAEGSSSDGVAAMAHARIVVEPISGVKKPSDITAYRLTIIGAPIKALRQLTNEGAVELNSGISMELGKNAAVFGNLGAAYRIELASVKPPAGRKIFFTVEALDKEKKPISSETVEGEFEAPSTSS